MDKFLKRHKSPKFTPEKIENLNMPIISKKYILVIKILPTKEFPDSFHW